jgi:DAACS family dicarboxylate/amino acid:cation (Na+ or H+) symporter
MKDSKQPVSRRREGAGDQRSDKPGRTVPHRRIFLGMLFGLAAGFAIRFSGLSVGTVEAIVRWVKPVGDIFLRLLFMTVMPVLISALALGVAELGDLRRIGRIGFRTLGFTVFVSSIAVMTGVLAVHLFDPAGGLSEADRQALLRRFPIPASAAAAGTAAESGLIDSLVKIVPKNPLEDMVRAFDPSYSGGGILAVIFFAFMLGIALTLARPEKVRTFKAALEGLFETMMKLIDIGMRFAPVGVFALLFSLSATMGFSILAILSRYVAVVLAGLLFHLLITYSALLSVFGRMRPGFFFRNTAELMLIAFSTSSSNATLPAALRTATDRLGLRKDVSRFVLTLGATANQNGTALYEGVTVLFLAGCFGVHLSFVQQVTVVLLCVLAGVGTAGVPGGSLPAVIMILAGIGVPAESMGIILGIDRLLDMSRTVVNVEGDLVAAAVVNRSS